MVGLVDDVIVVAFSRRPLTSATTGTTGTARSPLDAAPNLMPELNKNKDILVILE